MSKCPIVGNHMPWLILYHKIKEKYLDNDTNTCCSLISTRSAKGGAYNWLEYLMNKLKVIVLLVIIHVQVFYCTNTREYTNIRSCRGKLVLNLSSLQERIFVYTLVNCTINVSQYYCIFLYSLMFIFLQDISLIINQHSFLFKNSRETK